MKKLLSFIDNRTLFIITGITAVVILIKYLKQSDAFATTGGGSVTGWFTLTGPNSHGGACTPNTPGCICSDVHKCTPNASINGVNLFKPGWLPAGKGSCRPDLTVYGANYFDSACCPPGTYGGPPRPGPFSISCTPGVPGTGAGYQG